MYEMFPWRKNVFLEWFLILKSITMKKFGYYIAHA